LQVCNRSQDPETAKELSRERQTELQVSPLI
jgi:hypothetical protein